MAKNHQLGQKGEDLASQFLENIGYEILDRNWVYKKAELDIIAKKDQRLIFVEVKTRSGKAFGQPEEFVTTRKQCLMERAAAEYIYLMNHQGEIRFDIVSILFNYSEQFVLRHIEDAFWPELSY